MTMINIEEPGKTIITEAEAKAVLQKHADNLFWSIREAFDQWNDSLRKNPETFARFSSTTRANAVYDLIVNSAERRFRGVEGVTLLRKSRCLMIKFGPKVVLRFKKFNKRMRPSGIRTKTFLKYFGQGTLFPETEPSHLLAGYRTDEAGATIKDVQITLPFLRENRWNFEIFPTDMIGTQPIDIVPDESMPKIRPIGVEKKVRKSDSGI